MQDQTVHRLRHFWGRRFPSRPAHLFEPSDEALVLCDYFEARLAEEREHAKSCSVQHA